MMLRLGKDLMLPIAILPTASLLLRLGQPDILDIVFIIKAGQALFENLPLLFAISISSALAKNNYYVANLARIISYSVLTSIMQAINPELNMKVLADILAGLSIGFFYNCFHSIQLSEFLAFLVRSVLYP